MKSRRAYHITFVMQKIDNAEITGFANSTAFVHNRTQRFRHSWPGVEKVYINTPRTIMAGSHGLYDSAVFPRPPDAPVIHGANALGPILTQQLRKWFVAQSAAGRECVRAVIAPVVGSLGAERDGDGHLRHHRGATAANQAAVGENHLTTAARRFNRRVHAGSAGSDHQNVRSRTHRFLGHEYLASDNDDFSIMWLV
jgi:hypothetical protein